MHLLIHSEHDSLLTSTLDEARFGRDEAHNRIANVIIDYTANCGLNHYQSHGNEKLIEYWRGLLGFALSQQFVIDMRISRRARAEAPVCYIIKFHNAASLFFVFA